MRWVWVVAQEEKGWETQRVRKEQVKHPVTGVETIDQEVIRRASVDAQEEREWVTQREMLVQKAEVKHPVMKETSWERTDMMADLHVQTSHHGGLE